MKRDIFDPPRHLSDGPDRATKLQAYDLRLDRQIERTLAVLLKLQDVQPSLAAARATA